MKLVDPAPSPSLLVAKEKDSLPVGFIGVFIAAAVSGAALFTIQKKADTKKQTEKEEFEKEAKIQQLKKVDLVSVACLEAVESSVGYAGCGTPPYAPDPGPL